VIDTHCHILPGLDDGAKDEGVALIMARKAIADGVKTIIATPHTRESDFWNERDGILAAAARFRQVLQRESLDLKIVAGSEAHLGPKMIELIEKERLLTYADGRKYLLLECPYRTRPVRLEETIFEFKVAGITPVIAHPERIRFFQEDPEKLEEMIRLGCLAQMTSSSLVGRFGKAIAAQSEQWVRRGMVHLLGSDAHDPEYRPPVLAEARERWAELTDQEEAEQATEVRPQALIDGEYIEADPPLPPERKRGLISRIFGGSRH